MVQPSTAAGLWRYRGSGSARQPIEMVGTVSLAALPAHSHLQG